MPSKFTEQQKIEILKYAKNNSISAAAKKFGVSVGIIGIWNGDLHVFRPKQRTFTLEFKMEVLAYARDFGGAAAAEKYDVLPSQISDWNKKLKVYETQKRYSENEILEILNYAKAHGVVWASRQYNVAEATISRWNKTRNIYDERPMPNSDACTPAQQIQMLELAKKRYFSLPKSERSARTAFLEISTEYGITVDQLYVWNKKYKIVPVRASRQQTITQAEIDSVQSALHSSQNRIATASRKTGITAERISKMHKSHQVTFRVADVQTTPPVAISPQKSRKISSILYGLLRAKLNH